MRIERAMHLLAGGTSSGGYLPAVHDFIQSGSIEGPRLLAGTSTTLGSSDLSFAKSVKMVAVALAFASTVTLADNPALASVYIMDQLTVPEKAHCIESLKSRRWSDEEAKVRELRCILTAIDEDPVEDGVVHPAEARLSAYLQLHGSSILEPGTISGLRTSHVADALRLFGRVRGVDKDARTRLVRYGLTSSSVEVRDAAVQAAELWEDASLVHLLRQHRESTRWLADYASRVARELEG